MSTPSFSSSRARGDYCLAKVVERVWPRGSKESFKTESRTVSNSNKVYPESEEKDNFTVKVRCLECGNLLTNINIGDYEVSARKRFRCKSCKNSLLVLVNPFTGQRAM
jgi:transposase-like protein